MEHARRGPRMERPLKGDVVILPFPFSDLSQNKRRPAPILAGLSGRDCMLCQITSRQRERHTCIALEDRDFATGNLSTESMARIDRIFTADTALIIRKAGRLRREKMNNITEQLVRLLRT